ncbi:MAG: efflux RND transporter periplasmic adaptor subunit [Candidatus Latescibacteria bacterium]|nr:efflux RND transporter periplasmic adaptor subunit [Candidatus Latescibacterota bacterium]NIO27272.1 efflux RND transporter periplasmic adaptor subunit [Candidatus Latescibacterota bacterium]NIO54796.1 efflux RND transporter periplasmic adaptor subunit [Candidatus Latescibacterota bacterium]NIT00879.1 efflux RND transporter periplasmic adaptor subunit [Candidatus Latescibacterota bacterium]NIT37802.1 efflux RND transporter periplasmic adaptor subunit [Candidatus Latescibacterota bacterium]
MASWRKRGRIAGVVVFIVAVLIIATYVVRKGPGSGEAAGTADSLAASDTTTEQANQAAADSGKKGEEDDEKDVDLVPVEVAEAQPRKISSYYLTTAALEPEKQVAVLAKIAGEVKKLLVEEGAVVREGDLICELDDKEQKVALDEARINRDKQKREYERLRSIHERSLLSDKELSDIKYQYELAENQYEAALLRYEYTKIRAPFDGVITLREVDRGENVSIGSILFEIADTNPLLVRLYLPEKEIASVKVGQEVLITPDSDPASQLKGKITLISPSVDERTGTIKVTVETRGNAMPGSFVRVRIVTETHEETLAIPRRGVVSDAGETFVYVAEADSARKIEVRVGFEDEEYAEILGGIAEGDTVIVIGTGGLRTGTKIKILNRADADSVTQAARVDK